MGQVTIYVEDSALEAVKQAAERSKVSVSQWFAKYALEEKNKQTQDWDAFFSEIDQLRSNASDDFPSLEVIRATEVPDLPRETW
jgi:cupin superfamily acireductone dioxygenase involved in methionine salvage